MLNLLGSVELLFIFATPKYFSSRYAVEIDLLPFVWWW
jgi:hypothetical protein